MVVQKAKKVLRPQPCIQYVGVYRSFSTLIGDEDVEPNSSNQLAVGGRPIQ